MPNTYHTFTDLAGALLHFLKPGLVLGADNPVLDPFPFNICYSAMNLLDYEQQVHVMNVLTTSAWEPACSAELR